ncbi:DUF6470 family protein [Caryophanon latum]|uniref:YviE n=1 Tax=Caryophanon latum TaxID=33977 RepID=A0A1C0YI01_9BACL|nr:DUF6470 family protein [Caryophanon latum]OCS86805.1 hypothetical protein A6K76_14235 [Caryophanon latum]
MAIPQIQLQINNIKMDYDIKPPQVNISQPEAEMTIEQEAATLEINSEPGQLHIDQSQAFQEAGLKPISQVNKEYVEKGRQAVMESIAKAAQQGDMLMRGAGKGQRGAAIQQIAKQNDMVQPQKQIGLTFIPSAGAVKMDYTAGEVNVEIQAQKPKIDVKVNKPQIDLTYGTVKGTVAQRPSVEVYV